MARENEQPREVVHNRLAPSESGVGSLDLGKSNWDELNKLEDNAAQKTIDNDFGTPKLVDSHLDRSVNDHVKKQADGSTVHTNDKGQVTEVDRADGSVVKIKYGRDGNPQSVDEQLSDGAHIHYERTASAPGGDPFKAQWHVTFTDSHGNTSLVFDDQAAVLITPDGELHAYHRNKDGSWGEEIVNSDGSREQGDGFPPGVKQKWPGKGDHVGSY